MADNYQRNVTDEDRREFLKVLGATGVAAAGGVTLNEARQEMATAPTEELAPIGQAIQSDLGGKLDAGFLADQQAAFASAATALPAVAERGFPTDAPREEFQPVADAGQPIYDHLLDVGFFESTTSNLPEFTPSYLEKGIQTFVGSEALAAPLQQLDFTGTQGVDLLSTVVANAQQISDYHWVATDQIPREQIEIGQFIPAMTQGTAGGVLLWLEDLDLHLWQKQVLLTDGILDDVVRHARSMSVGFHLMTEGAKAIAAEDAKLSNAELGALFTTGFAVQAISQNLLPQDAYWVTEEMMAPRATNLETITE